MVIITILIILGIRAGMITTDFRWFHDVPCIGSSHSVQSLDVYSGLKSQALKENGAHWSCARGRRKSRRTTMSQALRWWYAACPSIGIPPNHLFFFADFHEQELGFKRRKRECKKQTHGNLRVSSKNADICDKKMGFNHPKRRFKTSDMSYHHLPTGAIPVTPFLTTLLSKGCLHPCRLAF